MHPSFSRAAAQSNASLKKKNLVLLELLGEKTEEMEELQGDLAEAKRVYKAQLEHLVGAGAHQPPPAQKANP